jgi:dihydrofolate reductase
VDWLMWSDEAAAIMADFWPQVDTVLMGRKTWEIAAKNGTGGEMPGISTYVFSRTMTEAPHGTTLVRDHAEDVVREMKQKPGKNICLMGGGDLARTFFEAGLIDEIGFNIHPVLLGQGIPLFHPLSRQIDLELLECKPFRNGCVYVRYRVKP